MRPVSFRVRKYRNIQDSGDVELAGNLTCIVGKNQSGKTALLRALHKFNPRDPDPYDLRREWPRGERNARDPTQVVCAVRFVLDEEETASLAEILGANVEIEWIEVTKSYEGVLDVETTPSGALPDQLHPSEIDTVTGTLPSPSEPVGETFLTAARECGAETVRLAKEGRFNALEAVRAEHDHRLQAARSPETANPQRQHEDKFLQAYLKKLAEIGTLLASKKTIRQRAHDWIVSRLPVFVYMDDYQEFQGTAALDQLLTSRTKDTLKPSDKTLLMILKLAGLDLEQLVASGKSQDQATIRERQYDLEDAGRTLTKNLAGRWNQTPYQVQFRGDAQTFLTEIEEVEKDIGMIPLEEQSKGFRWFFSFDLRFMHDSGGTFENCVLLLDEPGLHLHPGGQKDLLKRLDAYAAKNPLIYTTHLPFLVDLREPSRIRVMSEEDGGAGVSADLTRSGKDERLTLQAALGMRLDQHYLVAARNLVVEGADDCWLITELSNLMERSGFEGLPEDVMVSAAGGASEAVYMATFMIGQELDVVALFDSDPAGRRAEEQLRTKWLTLYKGRIARSVLLGDMAGVTGDFAIEDLFGDEFYVARLNECHADKLPGRITSGLALPTDSRLLVDRAAAACTDAGLAFNKGSVAKLIRRDLRKMGSVNDLPVDVRTRAQALMKAIKRTLDDLRLGARS